MSITVYKWTKQAETTSVDLSDWFKDQGVVPKSIAIGKDITLSADLVVPDTIDIVDFYNDARFLGNYNLTINKMSALPRYQIFGSGINLTFGPNAVPFILPLWFGSGNNNGNILIGSGMHTPLSKVYVEGGMSIGTNLSAGSGNLYVSGSGSFTGVVHGATPTIDTHLTTKLYVDAVSGSLNTRINNSGAYSATISGQLNTYITNTSGQLNDSKIPYSGAIRDVDLGEYKLSVSNIQFDLTPSGITNTDGLLRWNSTDGTLDLGMSSGDITMQLGQEMFIKARNVSGDTITNGSPVYASGRTGNRPNIYLAKSDSDNTSAIIGVTTQDITSPADGYITTMGYVRSIKTDYTGVGNWGTTWVTGDNLYVSKTVAGQLTNIEPESPHHSDIVGTVEIVHSNLGSILVNIIKHKTFSELTDVNGTTLTTSGQIATWNQASGFFDFNDNILNYSKTTHNHGLSTSGNISKYISASGFGNSLLRESGNYIINSGIVVFPKASGNGIMIDTVNPTYGWRDITSDIHIEGTASLQPTWAQYTGVFYGYQFSNGATPDQCFINFHIPHDYKLRTDLYIHTHWSNNVATTGNAQWIFDIMYASGHGNPNGYADKFQTHQCIVSGLQGACSGAYGHMICEVPFTSFGGASGLIDNGIIAVDGIVIARVSRAGTGGLDTLSSAPFLHFVDLHYQSTNLSTKQKTPNFYE